jgi:uncharacterized lipoprotein
MIKTGIKTCLLFLILISGCAPLVFVGGAIVGVGGYKYVEGAMTVVYQAPYENTWDSSIKALDELGYKIAEKKEKVGSGKIYTEGPETKKVTLSFKYMSQEETEVIIRVGLFGDENASNVIKDKIADILFK